MKLRVTTHSGEDDIINVESYNAIEVTELRNNNVVQAIQIGSASYSRIDIKNITVEEEIIP